MGGDSTGRMGDVWELERVRSGAAAHHAREPQEPVRRQVWVVDTEAPALVLGSTQSESHADRAACAAGGVDVVRRRSGGGAVLVVPGDSVWVDVVIPRHDEYWGDDVGRSANWLGRLWADALADVGLDDAVVHAGALAATPWSSMVCFANLAPGEVRSGPAKVVGISQRRTRRWARFQCVLHRHWDPVALVGLLRLSDEDRQRASIELASVAAGVDRPECEIIDAFLDRLGLDRLGCS